MNQSSDERGSSGINILWPNRANEHFKTALQNAKDGKTPNNISCIIKYSLNGGVTAIWMGDLEKDFMENIKDEISLPKTNILFAPHHGRKSGKIPQEWIDAMDPNIIVMVKQFKRFRLCLISRPQQDSANSAKDIIFECEDGKVHVYCSNEYYTIDFLDNEWKSTYDYYKKEH
ncbi:MAG: hypothetical protein R2750_01815 [Bacteroidales bacterium]